MAVATVLFLAATFRIIALNQPTRYYFDEIYHGYTAVQYTRNNPDAYNPWGQSEPGFANEWSHPPLAKLFMAAGVWAFGEQSWAWRIPSALFGTASIGLTGMLVYQLTRDYRTSFLSMVLLSMDGLHLVMSRIAMNDIFFVTFLLACFNAYWKAQYTDLPLAKQWRWFLLTGVLLGAALASKWTTLYAFGVLGFDQLMRWIWAQRRFPSWQELLGKTVLLGIVPILVYIASYAHMFALGFSWQFFWDVQQQMWWYHTNLVATHSYQSQPWQWLLDLRPVWMSVEYGDHGRANIYALGNPILLWSGLMAVAYALWRQLDRWSQGRWFLILSYFAFWVPWLISPRIMFFYHYFPSSVFLIALLAVSWQDWRYSGTPPQQARRQLWLLAFIVLAAGWLAIFSPHLLGVEIPTEWSNRLFLFPSWR